jgi:hypothetical protein
MKVAHSVKYNLARIRTILDFHPSQQRMKDPTVVSKLHNIKHQCVHLRRLEEFPANNNRKLHTLSGQ